MGVLEDAVIKNAKAYMTALVMEHLLNEYSKVTLGQGTIIVAVDSIADDVANELAKMAAAMGAVATKPNKIVYRIKPASTCDIDVYVDNDNDRLYVRFTHTIAGVKCCIEAEIELADQLIDEDSGED